MSKIERLYDAYEKFGFAIASIPDEQLQLISRICLDVRALVAEVRLKNPRTTPSQVVAGLEQGWRDTQELIQRSPAQWRTAALKAWYESTQLAHPNFLVLERQRLEKIVERGRIRSEAEFYLIQHEVDRLEGRPDAQADLHLLYSLIDAFESRKP